MPSNQDINDEMHLRRRLAKRLLDPAEQLSFFEQWPPRVLLNLTMYFSICFVLLSLIPNSIRNQESREFVYIIGVLGIWRYVWWLNHWVCAGVYAKIMYPGLRTSHDAF